MRAADMGIFSKAPASTLTVPAPRSRSADMGKKEPDVKVTHTAGCALCGRTDAHTHPQADWREHIDNTPIPGGK